MGLFGFENKKEKLARLEEQDLKNEMEKIQAELTGGIYIGGIVYEDDFRTKDEKEQSIRRIRQEIYNEQWYKNLKSVTKNSKEQLKKELYQCLLCQNHFTVDFLQETKLKFSPCCGGEIRKTNKEMLGFWIEEYTKEQQRKIEDLLKEKKLSIR
jgi:hypothetical protein